MLKRNRQVMVRLTPSEARQVLALAKLRGQSVGALLIDAAGPLLDAARRTTAGNETAGVGRAGGNLHRVEGRGDATASIAHDAPEGGQRATR